MTTALPASETPRVAPPGGAVGRAPELLELLLVVGYIDGELHPLERIFIRRYLDSVLLLAEELGGAFRDAYQAQFDAVYAGLDAELRTLADDRLRQRAVVLFRGLVPAEQTGAIELVLAMMHVDGGLGAREQALYHELLHWFTPNTPTSPTLRSLPPVLAGSLLSHGAPITVQATVWRPLMATAHPLLDPLEQTYSPHPVELQSQLAMDSQLLVHAMNLWRDLRVPGHGLLTGITDMSQIPQGAQFLDGTVHVLRPRRPIELVVLGDLHGCYACLKAALLQSNFVNRVWAHQWDPRHYPDVKLVLLGDYIDRGRFSFDGVLRAVLHLFVAMPDNVFVLRGNHEHFLSYQGQVYSAVHPAEGLASIAPYVPAEMLETYRVLFEQMPTALLFDRTLFVHGGIPRDDSFAARYQDLASLGDPELSFQMLWGDPAQTDHVPLELQRHSARFTFGRQQFRAFMERIGCHTMIRGHEQIPTGFDVVYDLGDRRLLNLFSAGGEDNRDLPPDSSYRPITPMALTVHQDAAGLRAIPWPIHYQPFNYAVYNGLYRPAPLLEYRYT